jgi:hypothetical protein
MVQRRKVVYILMSGTVRDDEMFGVMVRGVYSSKERAEEQIPEVSDETFFIYSIEVDAPIEETPESIIEELMKSGMVDQLIDEEGNFVYVLKNEDNDVR